MPQPTSTDDTGRDRNFILAAVPDKEYAQMRDRLEPVELGIKDMIYQADEPIGHVYFPTTAVLSMIAQVDGQAGVEVATIGREGMAGLPVFLGASTSPDLAFAQIRGRALRMPAGEFRDLANGAGAIQALLQRYTQAFFVQLAQGSACNRLHNLHQRLARWLLMTHDRVGQDEFLLTQEFMAQMLAVRRATVTEAAGRLQQAGLITYGRGIITIVDRAGLEAASCECYQIIADEHARLVG